MGVPEDRADQTRIEATAHNWFDRTAVPWKEYVDAINRERELALRTANEEREKAARAIRESTIRAINEGDERLREHISQQFAQISSALDSAEKLETARIDALRKELAEQIIAVRRELQAAAKAQAEAITKAEVATERRFESVNEWRGQSADRERSQSEQTARLTASFMPRELAESRYAEMAKQVDGVREDLSDTRELISQSMGDLAGGRRFSTTVIAWLTVAVSMSFLLAAILTHGFK